MTGRKIALSVVLVTGLAVLAWQSDALADKCHLKAQVGKPAPGFTLKDALGKEHSLSDFKGKIVVLEWTSQQCPFVVDHHTKQRTTQQAYAKYAGKDVIWLGIDSTHWRKPEENRLWAAKYGIAYPILHDPTGEVGRAYGAKTTPHLFVINKDGTLVYSGAIDDRKGQNHVTLALDALLAGKAPPLSETKPYGCSVKYGKHVAKGNGNGNGGDKAKAAKSGCSPCALTGKTAAKETSKKGCCGTCQ